MSRKKLTSRGRVTSYRLMDYLGAMVLDKPMCDPLSREEEEETVARAQAGDKTARDRLVVGNLRLVAKIAQNHRRGMLDYSDLFQAGTRGILAAIPKFDPSRGIRFISFASFWILSEMDREYLKHGLTVYIPAKHDRADFGFFSTDKQRYPGKDYHSGEMVYEANDMPVGTGQNPSWAEYIEGEQETPEEIYQNTERADVLEKVLRAKLSARERKVLESYFGLFGHERQTQDVIGQRFGISRQRVEQIKKKALQKLAKGKARNLLEDVL